jgi:hypothetical protein
VEVALGSSVRGILLCSLFLLVWGRREGAEAVGCGRSGIELYMADKGVVGAAEW